MLGQIFVSPFFFQTVRKMFVNYEDSLQGIILKVSEKCSFQKNLITPMITTQLDHFFGKEHFRYLRPRSHYSIFESVRFCLKHDEAKYLFSICFQLSTLMRFCVKTHHFRCIFSSPFSKVSVFTCAY